MSNERLLRYSEQLKRQNSKGKTRDLWRQGTHLLRRNHSERSLTDMDTPLLLHIFGFCEMPELIVLARTNSVYQRLVTGNVGFPIWRDLCEKDFNVQVDAQVESPMLFYRERHLQQVEQHREEQVRLEMEEQQRQDDYARNHGNLKAKAFIRFMNRAQIYALHPMLFFIESILLPIKLDGADMSWIGTMMPIIVSDFLFLVTMGTYFFAAVFWPYLLNGDDMRYNLGPFMFMMQGEYNRFEENRGIWKFCNTLALTAWITFTALLTAYLEIWDSDSETSFSTISLVIVFGVLMASLFSYVYVGIKSLREDNESNPAVHLCIFGMYFVAMFCTAILWYIKDTSDDSISYAIVLLPIFIVDGIYLFVPCWYKLARPILRIYQMYDNGEDILAHAFICTAFLVPFVTFEILLVVALNDSMDYIFAFIPIWLFLFCVCCGMCAGLLSNNQY